MIALALLAFAQYDMAQDYAMPQIEAMAQSYFGVSHTEKTKRISAHNAVQVEIDTLFLGEKPKMFLCQDGESWVILANEQSVEPIVCLGEGQVDLDELKESPLWFLLSESMMGLDSLRIKGVTLASDEEPNTTLVRAASHPTPLLDLEPRGRNFWAQSYNNNGSAALADHAYNKDCPTFFDCAQGHTYVGCTAVAMAQVMWYHKYPASAVIPSKINAAGTTYGDDVTRIYNWDNMPNALYNTTSLDKVNAVTGLLRDCGYAGHMIYSGTGSSMTLTNAISALRNTFDYSAHMKQYSSGATKFNNIIKTEIGAKRPVIIQATHKSNGGAHSFVIDGYDSATEMYHINMGWGTNDDNIWYSVSGTNCYGGYTIARRMLYEIIPNGASAQSVAYAEDELEDESEEINTLSIITRGDVLDIQSVSDNVEWIIYNIYGQLVLSGNDTYVNLSSLPMGAYTIVAKNENSVTQTTFIR